jgi:hypothetical protein
MSWIEDFGAAIATAETAVTIAEKQAEDAAAFYGAGQGSARARAGLAQLASLRMRLERLAVGLAVHPARAPGDRLMPVPLAVSEITAWDSLAILRKMTPDHPEFEKAVSAFIWIALADGWGQQAINRALGRWDLELVQPCTPH